MSTTTHVVRAYRVAGMTCSHCVAAVEREVGAIPDVVAVTADLASGDTVVASTRAITDDEMTAAVDEAGYRLES